MLNIHSIETFGVHDGPGIRMVIFLQGCNAHCLYCHNPDTQSNLVKNETSVEEIIETVMRQFEYINKNGGGVTISGGEPTLQAKELLVLVKTLKKLGINTALDSNGTIDNKYARDLYKEVDLLLLDVKHIDDGWHRKITGVSNRNTLEMAKYREETGKPMWLRYVLVPGYSDQPEFLKQFSKHFKLYKQIKKIEILPYHIMGVSKYKELGMEYFLKDVLIPSELEISQAKDILLSEFSDIIKQIT